MASKSLREPNKVEIKHTAIDRARQTPASDFYAAVCVCSILEPKQGCVIRNLERKVFLARYQTFIEGCPWKGAGATSGEEQVDNIARQSYIQRTEYVSASMLPPDANVERSCCYLLSS